MTILTNSGPVSANDLPMHSTKEVVSPTLGGSFTVAVKDVVEAVQLAPLWFHSGWVNVVWRYRRTRLGPFWHTIGLAAFVIVMGTLWSVILRIDPLEYFRFVSVNLIVWSLIASFITQGTSALIGAKSTALSMRIPYVYFAFEQVWRAILMFAHHFILYLAIMVGTLHSPGWPALLAIPGLLLLIANGLWLSLFFGIVCLRWRDLVPATGAAIQIAMFVTPIFWPKEFLGERLAFAADYNPLYHFVRVMREPLLGTVPPAESWLWVFGTFVVGSVVTLWVYGRNRNRLSYWY